MQLILSQESQYIEDIFIQIIAQLHATTPSKAFLSATKIIPTSTQRHREVMATYGDSDRGGLILGELRLLKIDTILLQTYSEIPSPSCQGGCYE